MPAPSGYTRLPRPLWPPEDCDGCGWFVAMYESPNGAQLCSFCAEAGVDSEEEDVPVTKRRKKRKKRAPVY